MNGGTSVIVKVHSSFPFLVIRREKLIILSILGMPHPTACGRRWVRDKRTALGTKDSIQAAIDHVRPAAIREFKPILTDEGAFLLC
jgi:hypothetical protein